jgi:hypothetical protein
MDYSVITAHPWVGELLAQQIAFEEMTAQGLDRLMEYSEAHYAHFRKNEQPTNLNNVFYLALYSQDPVGSLKKLTRAMYLLHKKKQFSEKGEAAFTHWRKAYKDSQDSA